MTMALFGTAGNPEGFYAQGLKHSVDIPKWLSDKGLKAYEYSAGRGVRIKQETAENIAAKAKEYDVKVSLHAPYFINLATDDESQMQKNLYYFTSSIEAASYLGADRVIFHAAGQGKFTRDEALYKTQKGLSFILDSLYKLSLDKVKLFPETMGKKGQIGNLAEVLELCQMDRKMLAPTVDFGHLHAASGGEFMQKEEYLNAFESIEKALGADVLNSLHVHFSKIEYTKAGEKRHWNFVDDFGPPFEPFIQAVVEAQIKPRVICESAGSQDIDALSMQNYYQKLLGGF